MSIYRLEPQLRNYAWGSRTALAELAGRPFPTDLPEAELWLGAHEEAPSGVATAEGRRGLDQWLAERSDAALGVRIADEFGGRLPFLLKVLAPARALSIQCHPSAEQAADAPPGTYPDAWPKPEAFLTVTNFEAFAGMLTLDEIAEVAGELGVPDFADLVDRAASPVEVLESLLRLPQREQRTLSDSVAQAAAVRQDDTHLAAIAKIASEYPGDIGAAVLLIMRHHVLPPNRYVFVPAGVLHAYVQGVAVEILANSDNVVRAGLTPKELNTGELLRITDASQQVSVQRPSHGARVHQYPLDSPYFRLTQVFPGGSPTRISSTGPRIVLCIGGDAVVDVGGESVRLGPLESCFVPADSDQMSVSGSGTAYVASVGASDIRGQERSELR